ncbi:hypothetical protein EDD18DRAFT_1163806 [Armillaria luteobubalina]|uniref:Uncharacterized protein n=1 Tax=Armillaria luteobubalina TaxID=153913 RepID=A0AA39Q660_9AGAR|nr:hypothetical protein EDD18DRAFT_1163806 [Armillaria luteobubalina]
MSSESEPASNSSHSSHLGTSWEIAVVSVCIVVVIALVATTVFHFRRKARRERQMQLDAEQGQAGHEMDLETSSKLRLDSDLAKPLPTASKRSSRHSSYDNHCQKPTRYYWDYQ